MSAGHRIYRSLILLYPKTFRAHYGDDLLQQFAELVADRGAPAAWGRTGIDLVVTLPRYRLESLMTEQHSATTLNVTISLLAGAGLLSVIMGLYPGLVLVVAAVALAIAQRGTLARALRAPDSNRRRRRLVIGGALTVTFVVSYATYLALIGDRWTVRETVLATVGTLAMFGAPCFLIAGLLTPKGLADSPVTPLA